MKDSDQTFPKIIQDLITSNSLSELLLNNSDEALYFYTMDNKLVFVNKVFEKVTGYKTNQLYKENYIDFIHPDDKEWTSKLWAGLFEEKLFEDVKYRIIRKSGEVRWCLSSWKIIYNDKNEPVGIFGKQQDITENVDKENLLIKNKDKADHENSAKSTFLANLSHEIRTPLTGIIGFADLLELSPDMPKEKQKKYLRNIQNSGKHLSLLIDGILDFSKIDAGFMVFENVRVELPELISSVFSVMEAKANEKKIDFDLSYENPIPQFINTDPTRLRQVFYNLLGNAIKFTDTGSVKLRVYFEDKKTRLCFHIEDTGIGIAPENIEKIFLPFNTVDVNITKEYGGTGLGLSLSKKIVENLGGEIELVDSKVGVGSTFLFCLDCNLDDDIAFLKPEDKMKYIDNVDKDKLHNCLIGKSILVVEDGTDNIDLLGETLNISGASYNVVKDGKSAVQINKETQFDIILMDLQLPKMGGYQATKLIRQDGYKGIIIALSAFTTDHNRSEALENGFNDFLAKPFSLTKLINLLIYWSIKDTSN